MSDAEPLFKFQDDAVEKLVANDRLFLAAEMGLGKTRMVIEAAKKRGARRVLVCAPAIGQVSWPSEIEKWNPDAFTMPISDPDLVPDAFGASMWPTTYVIAPFSEIQRRPAAWVKAAQRYGADVTALDEAHFLGHHSAARTQAIYGFRADLKRAMCRPDQVIWPMSGTPYQSYTSELWVHLHALAPKMIASPVNGATMSEDEFRQRFSQTRLSTYGVHVTGSVNTPLLRRMTNGLFHRIRKAEVRGDMPPILWTHEPLPITSDQASTYLDIPDGLDDAELLDWLAVAHPNGSVERKAVGMAKIAGAIEWCRNFLENSDRKLILFGWHRDVIEPIHAALGPEFGSVMIHGGTQLSARKMAVDSFQQKGTGPRLFVGQMEACGTMITLTEASDVAFIEDDTVPGRLEQAAARADRLGQLRGVVARILYTPGTKDERIARARVRKAREFDLMFNVKEQK